MTLNDNDYREIAAKIEEGEHTVEYEKDGDLLCIDYEYDTGGYVEDDARCGYEKGTGAWIETWRCLYIHSTEAYDKEGEKIACDVDESLLERLIA